jgi:hypothetical protein
VSLRASIVALSHWRIVAAKAYADGVALSPNSRYLLGGVLAVFAGITYYMDQLVPEEKEEPLETVFDRRAKEGTLGQILQRPS